MGLRAHYPPRQMPVSDTAKTSHAEEVCLDAEAWATELEAWVKTRPAASEASDVKSLAAMLRAIVKSVQLSIIADEDPDDREFLVEELEQAIATARSLADGSHRLGQVPLDDGEEEESPSAPPSLTDGIKTKPPPKPPVKPPVKPKKPKEQWDPNSPFLPPS